MSTNGQIASRFVQHDVNMVVSALSQLQQNPCVTVGAPVMDELSSGRVQGMVGRTSRQVSVKHCRSINATGNRGRKRWWTLYGTMRFMGVHTNTNEATAAVLHAHSAKKKGRARARVCVCVCVCVGSGRYARQGKARQGKEGQKQKKARGREGTTMHQAKA